MPKRNEGANTHKRTLLLPASYDRGYGETLGTRILSKPKKKEKKKKEKQQRKNNIQYFAGTVAREKKKALTAGG